MLFPAERQQIWQTGHESKRNDIFSIRESDSFLIQPNSNAFPLRQIVLCNPNFKLNFEEKLSSMSLYYEVSPAGALYKINREVSSNPCLFGLNSCVIFTLDMLILLQQDGYHLRGVYVKVICTVVNFCCLSFSRRGQLVFASCLTRWTGILQTLRKRKSDLFIFL